MCVSSFAFQRVIDAFTQHPCSFFDGNRVGEGQHRITFNTPIHVLFHVSDELTFEIFGGIGRIDHLTPNETRGDEHIRVLTMRTGSSYVIQA